MPQPERKSRPDWLGTDGEIRHAEPDVNRTGVLDDLRVKKGAAASFRPRFPELHFSTALFIDGAVRALEDQAAQARRIQPDGLAIDCETYRQDPDRARFRLSGSRGVRRTAELIGTMQRWEGDRTRIDGDFKLYPVAEPKRQNAASAFTAVFTLVLIFVGVLVQLISGAFPGELMIALFIIAIIGSIIASYTERANQEQRRLKQALNAQESHDLNLLVDILVAAYRSHDVQWIKPPQ